MSTPTKNKRKADGSGRRRSVGAEEEISTDSPSPVSGSISAAAAVPALARSNSLGRPWNIHSGKSVLVGTTSFGPQRINRYTAGALSASAASATPIASSTPRSALPSQTTPFLSPLTNSISGSVVPQRPVPSPPPALPYGTSTIFSQSHSGWNGKSWISPGPVSTNGDGTYGGGDGKRTNTNAAFGSYRTTNEEVGTPSSASTASAPPTPHAMTGMTPSPIPSSISPLCTSATSATPLLLSLSVNPQYGPALSLPSLRTPVMGAIVASTPVMEDPSLNTIFGRVGVGAGAGAGAGIGIGIGTGAGPNAPPVTVGASTDPSPRTKRIRKDATDTPTRTQATPNMSSYSSVSSTASFAAASPSPVFIPAPVLTKSDPVKNSAMSDEISLQPSAVTEHKSLAVLGASAANRAQQSSDALGEAATNRSSVTSTNRSSVTSTNRSSGNSLFPNQSPDQMAVESPPAAAAPVPVLSNLQNVSSGIISPRPRPRAATSGATTSPPQASPASQRRLLSPDSTAFSHVATLSSHTPTRTSVHPRLHSSGVSPYAQSIVQLTLPPAGSLPPAPPPPPSFTLLAALASIGHESSHSQQPPLITGLYRPSADTSMLHHPLNSPRMNPPLPPLPPLPSPPSPPRVVSPPPRSPPSANHLFSSPRIGEHQSTAAQRSGPQANGTQMNGPQSIAMRTGAQATGMQTLPPSNARPSQYFVPIVHEQQQQEQQRQAPQQQLLWSASAKSGGSKNSKWSAKSAASSKMRSSAEASSESSNSVTQGNRLPSVTQAARAAAYSQTASAQSYVSTPQRPYTAPSAASAYGGQGSRFFGHAQAQQLSASGAGSGSGSGSVHQEDSAGFRTSYPQHARTVSLPLPPPAAPPPTYPNPYFGFTFPTSTPTTSISSHPHGASNTPQSTAISVSAATNPDPLTAPHMPANVGPESSAVRTDGMMNTGAESGSATAPNAAFANIDVRAVAPGIPHETDFLASPLTLSPSADPHQSLPALPLDDQLAAANSSNTAESDQLPYRADGSGAGAGAVLPTVVSPPPSSPPLSPSSTLMPAGSFSFDLASYNATLSTSLPAFSSALAATSGPVPSLAATSLPAASAALTSASEDIGISAEVALGVVQGVDLQTALNRARNMGSPEPLSSLSDP